jgi:guanylate kinase
MARMSKLFVISAPSGAGKTSLVRALLERRPGLVVSVSHTTRKPREQEADGRDYHFVSKAQFEQMVQQGAFLEHACVFGNFYGTGATPVRAQLDAGRDVMLEIDWQGAQQVRSVMPECVTIFVLPPSWPALQQRLEARRTDSAETIARRLADAVADMSHYREFDFVVVNDRFERAVEDLTAILDGHGEALRADRASLAPLVEQLLQR